MDLSRTNRSRKDYRNNRNVMRIKNSMKALTQITYK